MSIADQYRDVRIAVDKACRSAGRDPADVLLVAVSKTVAAGQVQQALDAGAADFGENRPDDLLEKHAAYPHAHWHFIGNVQSRRIPDIVSCASLVHSVYKTDHLSKFEAAAAKAGKVQDILLEVNVSGEASKGGVTPQEATAFLEAARGFSHVRVRGLMTMAPIGDANVARACFAGLRELRDSLVASGVYADEPLSELSMGMTDDWPHAVEEGATILRVGRAIFSESFA